MEVPFRRFIFYILLSMTFLYACENEKKSESLLKIDLFSDEKGSRIDGLGQEAFAQFYLLDAENKIVDELSEKPANELKTTISFEVNPSLLDSVKSVSVKIDGDGDGIFEGANDFFGTGILEDKKLESPIRIVVQKKQFSDEITEIDNSEEVVGLR
ncbi:MAG: hypothetical protein HQK54_14820 [Oligoflexales bacterium]|nr:hypothetical protein [Oligoflexales bacterium]